MPEAQCVNVDDSEFLWPSPSHACPRKLQENMAVDTDASTLASTEADKSCFCASCLCVHGRVLDVAYKVWLLILPLPPYTRMRRLKRMLPLTRLSSSIDRLQLHEHPLAVASSSRETFAAVWRSWSNKRKQRRRSRRGGACKEHVSSNMLGDSFVSCAHPQHLHSITSQQPAPFWGDAV